MRVDLVEQGPVAVIAITGEADLADRSQFADEVLGKLPDDTDALVVDLTDLTYIDSAGVRSLFEIAAALRGRDQCLALALPEDSLLRSVLKMTQVDEVAPVCPTRDEAVAVVSA